MKSNISAEKSILRTRMSALRASLPAAMRQEAAQSLIHHARLPAFHALLPPAGGVIGGFIPIHGEINPLPLMQLLAEKGFRLALPRITAEGLVFHAYVIGDMLVEGPFKTREPHPDAPLATPSLILAALLAFDRQLYRIGYGKAYYDRAFAAHPVARRIGIAFAAQEVDHVPREAHDKQLDAILTEAGIVIGKTL